jgi:hypothetical protein
MIQEWVSTYQEKSDKYSTTKIIFSFIITEDVFSSISGMLYYFNSNQSDFYRYLFAQSTVKQSIEMFFLNLCSSLFFRGSNNRHNENTPERKNAQL